MSLQVEPSKHTSERIEDLMKLIKEIISRLGTECPDCSRCMSGYFKSKRDQWMVWGDTHSMVEQRQPDIDLSSPTIDVPKGGGKKQTRKAVDEVEEEENEAAKGKRVYNKKSTFTLRQYFNKVLDQLSDYCTGYFQDIVDHNELEEGSVTMQFKGQNTQVHLVVDGSKQEIQTPKSKEEQERTDSGKKSTKMTFQSLLLEMVIYISLNDYLFYLLLALFYQFVSFFKITGCDFE
ncbi:hypothetical protein PPL_10311 [Heterostelium album PN500]|uniref:Uncharacterized protein n=1 Tax=Heterostelium pallidum (strain ATCC 26659 / Pp 5 / PN500) TaxID=670386 RepID=D3BPZ2_HETP5|nr:hypothetical protein PPL_10311 [Heterostelium album PN500]EFA76543.1 hypothetical protein PPL_10311 [Heterostelium album PN500]|eukprot:XP_020428675.1 hypothetical protein PPL_10311 [Heterostelium album PN500]